MKRVIIAVLLALFPSAMMAQTTTLPKTTVLPKTTLLVSSGVVAPGLVQMFSLADWGMNQMGGGVPVAGTTLTIRLKRPSGAGNLLTLKIPFDDTASPPTIADDKSNTWATARQCKDTTNGEDISIYYAAGITAATQLITITYHATSSFGSGPIVAEWSGMATSSPLDTSSCNILNAGTSITAGSATPASSGDLVVQAAWNDTVTYDGTTTNPGNGIHYTAGASGCTGGTWKLLDNSNSYGTAAQYCFYASTSALNPTMTESASHAVSAAAFFKVSNGAGTPTPAGMQILGVKYVPSTTWTGAAHTINVAGPSAANLIVANWSADPTDITAITDSHSNTWNQTGTQACDAPVTACIHNHYAGNATVDEAMSLSVTWSANTNDFLLVYFITGAKTSPFDKRVTGTGTQSVAGNLTYLSISPSTSTGVVLLNDSHGANTTNTLTSPTGVTFDGCYLSVENITGDGCAANNSWGNVPYSSTASQTWTASFVNGGLAVNNWVAEADAYEAP